MNYEHTISLEVMFQALSSTVRLEIVKLIADRQYCVNAIADALNQSQTSISQHLRVLRLAGIVESSKIGKEIHYSLSFDAIMALHDFLFKLCKCKHNHKKDCSKEHPKCD